MDFFTSFVAMKKPVADFLENAHRELDPQYKAKQDEAVATIDRYKLMAVAALAVSVFFAFLGLQFVLGGHAIIGCFIELVSFPVAFIAYNGYKVLENLRKVALNPKYYSDVTKNGLELSREKVKNCLIEGTLFLKDVADVLSKHVPSHGKIY